MWSSQQVHAVAGVPAGEEVAASADAGGGRGSPRVSAAEGVCGLCGA